MLDVMNEFMPNMLAIGLISTIVFFPIVCFVEIHEYSLRKTAFWPIIETVGLIIVFLLGSLALFTLSVTMINLFYGF